MERRELPDLVAESDVVTLHVPLSEETRHLVDAELLERFKPGSILVNTSRGGLVETAALVQALRSGPLAAAGLDVYENEPEVPAELRELENVVLAPHIGSATRETRNAMARLAAENVIAVLEGREPPTPGDLTRLRDRRSCETISSGSRSCRRRWWTPAWCGRVAPCRTRWRSRSHPSSAFPRARLAWRSRWT